jgi:hypothetical protein
LSLLLLATIGLQVAEPIQGLQRDRGSAFSAATSDVALAPSRRLDTARVAIAPVPTPVLDMPLAILAAPVRLAAPALRPDSTGPPGEAILARQPAPRAPPTT